MTQARLEGLAIRKGIRNFLRPDATIAPPRFFYPTIGIGFVAQNYLPGIFATWQKYPQERHRGVYGRLYDRTAVRAREVICLLAIFLEHAREEPMLSDYCLLFDRTIFTLLSLNPVLRLGMPQNFGEFVRQSLFSITLYFYSEAKTIRACFEEVSQGTWESLRMTRTLMLFPSVVGSVMAAPNDVLDYLVAYFCQPALRG